MFERLYSITYLTEFGLLYTKLKLKTAQIDPKNIIFTIDLPEARKLRDTSVFDHRKIWYVRYVLKAEILRSEIWFEIKILLYKSTPRNTKMASELEFDAK